MGGGSARSTPTAAAELLSPDVQQLQTKVLSLWQRSINQIHRQLVTQAQQVDWLSSRLIHPKQRLDTHHKQLAHYHLRLKQSMQSALRHHTLVNNNLQQRFLSQSPQKLLNNSQTSLFSLSKQLHVAYHHNLKQKQLQFQTITSRLNTVSPLATLERGFTITRNGDANGSIIRHASDLTTTQTLHLTFQDGSAECNVTATNDSAKNDKK